MTNDPASTQESALGNAGFRVARSDGELPGELMAVSDGALSYKGLEEMLGELLDRVRASLRVDTAAVLLLDEERGVLVARAARGLEEEVRQGVQVPLARGFAGRVAAGNRPIIIEDLDRAEVVNPILRQKGIRSMLGVPLRVEAHVIGVMHVGTLERRDFDDTDVALLQRAADRAAVAIDDGRIAEQRSVTSIMQRTLLPAELPDVPGVRFSAKYLPAGSGVKVGGDWYDVFWLPSGRLAFVIGDVVGRGVVAASVMAEIRTTLRAYLMEGHELAKVASLLNALMISLGRNRAATLCLMGFDLETAQLEVLIAGHLPPLVVDSDGTARLLEQPPGLPIGISSSQLWATEHHHFGVGSTLLLYTDGLVERHDESIDTGLERLRVAAEKATRASDASFADRVYRAVLRDPEFHDDVALLAIESLPLDHVLDLNLRATDEVLAGLRSAVTRWLSGFDMTAEEHFDVVLSTSEAAANAIQHAYGAGDAAFSVHVICHERTLTIEVKDGGRWRTARPLGGGRGLGIMRSLMDAVTIDRTEAGTVVTMTKELSTPR